MTGRIGSKYSFILCFAWEFWSDWHDGGASLPQVALRTYKRWESEKFCPLIRAAQYHYIGFSTCKMKFTWSGKHIWLWVMEKDMYLFRACSLVSSFEGSKLPVSRFTLETGFFNNSSPTLTRLFRFSFVEVSTVDTVPLNVSSCKSSVILCWQQELWLSRDEHFFYLIDYMFHIKLRRRRGARTTFLYYDIWTLSLSWITWILR